MKECDILRGEVKTHSDPSYISSGVRTPQPQEKYTPVIYVVAGLLGAYSG